jgi:vacuolar-type H+-ATPase subunit E/Vma4
MYGNLDDLLASVRRRAEQRALVRRASSEEQAERILDEARQRAEAVRAELLEQGRRDAAESCRQCLAVADLERRERRLAAREERLAHVFDAARAALLDAYAKDGLPAETLRRLALDALASLPEGEATLQLDAASRARLDADEVASWPTGEGHAFVLDDEPLTGRHGLVVRVGRASVDATLEGRLERARAELRGRVAGLLAAHGGDASDGTATP